MRWLIVLFLGWLAFAGCSSSNGPCTNCNDGSVDGWDGGGDAADQGGDGSGGEASDQGGDGSGGEASDQGGDEDGGAKFCGGLIGAVCDKGDWCDYPRNDCGGADDQGVCNSRPKDCPKLYQPVCACDNKVYDNECFARLVGLDVNDFGSCQPPTGQFACGSVFCPAAQDYCRRNVSDVTGIPDTWECIPFPASCGAAPTCACLSGEPCGNACEKAGDSLRLTCPGG